MMLGVLPAASSETSAGALDLQYGSPIKLTDATLGFPFLCTRCFGLQGTVEFEDNGEAPDPEEDETNGRTAELAKISMMQDGREVACGITRGACELPRKNDVQFRPTRSLEPPGTEVLTSWNVGEVFR